MNRPARPGARARHSRRPTRSRRRPMNRPAQRRGPPSGRSHGLAAHSESCDTRLGDPKPAVQAGGFLQGVVQSSVPAACVATLLGAATAMVVTGLTFRLGTSFALTDFPIEAVVGGALFALAIGVAVPTRLATWVCATAWRRFVSRGKPSQISEVLLNHGSVDRPLYWVVLSVIALGGGIATALLPLNVRLVLGAYEWLHAHFVWSAAPLEILHVGLVLAAGFVPLTILGLAVSCAHHLSCRWGRWDTKATGWWLIGGFAGAWLGSGLVRWELAVDMVFLVASLPALAVAVVSAGVSSAGQATWKGDEKESSPLPMWSDRWPRLLRASIVAVGGGGAYAATVWAGHPVGGHLAGSNVAPAMLLAMGMGVLAACLSKRLGLRSIGGFGVASASAGVVVAGMTAALAHVPGAGRSACWLAGWITVAVIGYATAYGRKTLLDRVASRSAAGAKVLAYLLACSGLTVWLAAPRMVRWVGEPATLVLLALSLLALGGMLIIHEPSYSPGTRRLRLCAVFASVAAMILVSSSPSSPWRATWVVRPPDPAGSPSVEVGPARSPPLSGSFN